MKRSWDFLSDDQRRKATADIIAFYQSERNEEIGVIAAGELLDMFLQTVGKQIYNKGVDDAYSYFKSRIDALGIDIESEVKK